MIQFGIIDANDALTDLGRALHEDRHDDHELYRVLAVHLLRNVKGVALIECLIDMNYSGEKIDLPAIRKALEERGIHTSSAGKTISLLRAWLDKAGLFRDQWVPDVTAYQRILEVTQKDLKALSDLTPGQRAVLRLLASLGPDHYDSSSLRTATEQAYPVSLNEKQFPKDVLYPLRDLGYITLERKGGRAWTLDVSPTEKLDADVIVPLLDQLGGLPKQLRDLLRMNVADIVRHLDSGDRGEKGLALEAFGFKLMRIIGLSNGTTRHRPSQARFEADLIFDSDTLAYSRWQIQCKNTAAVELEDVAKEVGLVYHLLSNVIVILTRGRVGRDARTYANDVMKKTNLAIILIERPDVDQIVSDPLRIFDVLKREASGAMMMKPQVVPGRQIATPPSPVDTP